MPVSIQAVGCETFYCNGLDLRLKGLSIKGSLKKTLKVRADPSHARKEWEQINNPSIKQMIFNFSQRMYSVYMKNNK